MPAGTGCLVTDSHFFYSKQVAFLVQLEGDGDHLLEELQETRLLLSIEALSSDHLYTMSSHLVVHPADLITSIARHLLLLHLRKLKTPHPQGTMDSLPS